MQYKDFCYVIIFCTRRTPLVVDAPLVWWNQFFGTSIMDARQAACRRRPRELLVKVVAPSRLPQFLLWPTPEVLARGCCPYDGWKLPEIGRPSDIFVACLRRCGPHHHKRSADQSLRQNGLFSPLLLDCRGVERRNASHLTCMSRHEREIWGECLEWWVIINPHPPDWTIQKCF